MSGYKQRLLRQALGLIAQGGTLTPQAVVAAAKDPTNPLHNYFEWRDDIAAEAFRIDQARTLIRSVKVNFSVDNRVVSTVYYVRNPDQPGDEAGYISLPRLRTDKELAHRALVDEFSRAAAILKRARNLAQVLSVEPQLDEALDHLQGLQVQIEASETS